MGVELGSVPPAGGSSDTINLCSLDIVAEQPVDPFAPVSRLDDRPPAAPVVQVPGQKVRRHLVRWAFVLGGLGMGALAAALILGILDRHAAEPAASPAAAAAPPALLPVAAPKVLRSPPATPIARCDQGHGPKGRELARERPAAARKLGSPAGRRLRESLAAARRAIERRDWRQARRTAVTALKLDARNQQARSMKRQAERKIQCADRRAFVAKLAAQRKDWRRARKEAQAALRIDPHNPRAKAIKARAQSRLRAESRRHQRTVRG